MQRATLEDFFLLGLEKKGMCLSTKPENINKPILWICNVCGNKFMESYNNIKLNNKWCLKCSYQKFNSKKKG